ncbi:MAG: DUF4349 domain-containing protein [Christensenellales bacterium]
MTCEQFRKSICLYLDKSVSDPEMEHMNEHLRTCPACREEYESQRMLVDALGAVPEAPLPPHFHERLHIRLQTERQKKEGVQVKRKLRLPVLSAVAAGLLLLVVGSAALLGGDPGLGHGAPRSDEFGYTSGQSTNNNMSAAGGRDGWLTGKSVEEAEKPELAPAPTAPGGDMDLATPDIRGQGETVQENANVSEGRKIIYSARIGVRTRQFDEDMAAVRQACAAVGGYVENAYVEGVGFDQPGGNGRTGTITVRIPQTAYGQFLTEVSGLGQVTSSNEYTQDITAQYVDYGIRLGTLELQLERLEDILEKSEKLEDVVLLVQEISRVTSQIEQIKGQLRLWDDLVDYSSVTVTLTEVQESTIIEPTDPTLGDRMAVAFFGTLNAIKRGLQSFAVRLVGATPYIILLAALALIAVAVTVALVRRRRARAAASVPAPAPKEDDQ